MRRQLATKHRTGESGLSRVAWHEKSGTHEGVKTTDLALVE